MNAIEKLYHKFRELILYGIIGGFCAALDFGVFTLLGLIIPFLVANIISVHCGIICSFLLNRNLNFKVKDKTRMRFLSFYLIGLSGLGISELLLWIFSTRMGLNHIAVKLATVIVVALYQFLLNKYITFKTSKNG